MLKLSPKRLRPRPRLRTPLSRRFKTMKPRPRTEPRHGRVRYRDHDHHWQHYSQSQQMKFLSSARIFPSRKWPLSLGQLWVRQKLFGGCLRDGYELSTRNCFPLYRSHYWPHKYIALNIFVLHHCFTKICPSKHYILLYTKKYIGAARWVRPARSSKCPR